MSVPVVTCPQCRALNSHGSSQCFLCDRSLVGLRPDAAKVVPWTNPRRRGGTFHIATFMLVIALIAAYLGMAVTMPAIAIVLGIPGLIALIATLTLPGRHPGGNPSTLDHLKSFLATFAVVVVVIISSVVAFFGTCLGIVSLSPGPYGGDFALTGIACGAIAAIAVPIALCVAIARARGQRFRGSPPTGRRT